MKKAFFLLLPFFIFISSCNKNLTLSENQDFKTFKQSKHNDIPDYFNDGRYQFEMKIDPTSFNPKTKEITIIIRNNGETISYGSPYEIEVYKNEAWQKIRFKDNFGFTLIAYLLKKDEIENMKIGLDSDTITYNIQPGYYRVVKEFIVNKNSSHKIKLASIFQLK